jgi:Txe/YoeB family toxin of Txe-Axe toxin-antitoxin module
MKINIHLLRSVYSFTLIKVQTDLKLWSNKNRVKRTPFLSIQKPERLPRSSLATLRIS